MAYFEWNDSMSVGSNTFDEHHKKLISYINDLHDAMKNGKGREILGELLKSLYNYTVFHFSKEEEKLTAIKYPQLEEQKKQHKFFVDKIKEYDEKIKNQELLVSIEILDFLSNWLKNHILKIDMEYKKFMN